ncbi:sensor histidine kinase [Streptomyces olivoreticuli]|uniref:sensor histidine kinase n=1 Tax=Streptomyces olivoreticuli TaxID=68246 RepID=UPI000E2637CF|nr:histidine kinase [Streptomyces olivoreticuli]
MANRPLAVLLYPARRSVSLARLSRIALLSGPRPSASDIALAALAALVGVSEVFSGVGDRAVFRFPTIPAVLTSVALGALLLVRRRFPVTVAAIVGLIDCLVVDVPALVLAMYTLGRYSRTPWTWVVGVSVVALNAFSPAGTHTLTLQFLSYAAVFVIMPVVVGAHIRTRHELIQALSDRANRMEREQMLAEERGRSEERNRITGEMHDVVAHRVTHIVLHAGSLQMNVGKRDQEWIAGQADLIRTTATRVLEELHDILRVLRRGQPGVAQLAPPPGIDAIPPLIAETRKVGLQVEETCSGAPRPLPPQLEQTIYRIVRESLTNALKYAPDSSTSVGLCYAPGRFDVHVSNGPSSGKSVSGVPSGGQGLVGLAERVELLGGRFHYGPSSDGGFRVEASLPTLSALPRTHSQSPRGEEEA